jgi:hypothetical protein
MSYAELLLALMLGLCAAALLVRAATHYVLAAVYRRPDVGFVFALNLVRLFYHPEFYSGSGQQARLKSMRSFALFLVCAVAALVMNGLRLR